MADVFLERSFAEPLTVNTLQQMVEDSVGCFGLYRITRPISLLSSDMTRMVCHFVGPDTESVRIALRQLQTDMSRMWPGTIHDAPGVTAEDIKAANVLVQRYFDESTELADIQAIEDAGAACLEMRGVKFVRTYFSTDQKSMVCLYQAPDAESVRTAQRQANMPFDDIWAFRRLPGQGQ